MYAALDLTNFSSSVAICWARSQATWGSRRNTNCRLFNKASAEASLYGSSRVQILNNPSVACKPKFGNSANLV